MHGSHVELRDEGEGWFAGVADRVIGGTIENILEPLREGERWYVVRFDHVLDVQECGHQTVSGLRLVRCERALVRARHVGEDLTPLRSVSTHVCLVPIGSDPAQHLRSIHRPDAWASCALQDLEARGSPPPVADD